MAINRRKALEDLRDRYTPGLGMEEAAAGYTPGIGDLRGMGRYRAMMGLDEKPKNIGLKPDFVINSRSPGLQGTRMGLFAERTNPKAAYAKTFRNYYA